MDFSDIGDVLNSGSSFLDTAGDFLKLVRELKAQFHNGQVQNGQVQNGQGGAFRSGGQSAWGLPSAGPSLAPEVRQVAAANGAAWVPDTTAGYGGVDLTGVWCPPMNPFDRCAIRQSGAYLNVSAMMGGTMIFAGEGMVNPPTGALAFAGRYANGAPAEVRAQLLPNGMINGVLAVQQPWGFPMTNPLFLQRAQ